MTNIKPFKRTERVSLQIQQILGDISLKYIDLSHLGFITFTHVTISPDLRHAKVFFSILNNKYSIEKITTEMNKLSKAFRKYLGHSIILKNIPDLLFIHDDGIEYEEKMMRIMKDLDINKT